jgi:hypothetical protein
MILGSAIAFIGFFLPWFGYSYNPPGSFAAAHPLYPSPYRVYQQFYDGISMMWFDSGLNGNARDLHIVVEVLEVLAAIALMLILAFASAAPRNTDRRKQIVIHVLSVLISATGAVKIVQTTFGADVEGTNQALARAQFAADYGGSAAARQAAQYWDFHTGIGIYLILIGGGAALLGACLPQRWWTADQFDAFPKWYRQCANTAARVGEVTVRGMFVLIALSAALVVGIILDTWLVRHGIIRF